MSSSSREREPYAASLDAYPNYLRRRPLPPAAQPARLAGMGPWPIAAVAYLLGTAVLVVLGFLLGLAGVVVAVAQRGDSDAGARLMVFAVVGLLVITAASVYVQARFIRAQGGARAVWAPVAATIAGWIFGAVTEPLGLPFPTMLGLQAALAVTIMALVISRGSRGR